MIIAGTGSRSLALTTDEFKEFILNSIKSEISLHQPDFVMSGMAEGFDTAIALAAIQLDIPLLLAIPNKGYGDYYWGRHSQYKTNRKHIFDWYLSKAHTVYFVTNSLYVDGVHSNFVRNQYMVDNADRFIVYGDSLSPSPHYAAINSKGTRDCLMRIERARKPYTIVPSYPPD